MRLLRACGSRLHRNVDRSGQQRQILGSHVRNRNVVKLKQIADVKIGLQTGDNPRYYRAASGVVGGAARGGYQTVSPENVLSETDLAGLTPDEKANGIAVDDPTTDRYFVPLDKAGRSDIEGGRLPLFWQRIEFYINWSRNAVSEMRTNTRGVFRNPQFYFRRGVSFSTTGIYSPTFRLSHGGVFDQKSSCVFSDILSADFLLGILASTLTKYFIKSFINHGVDAQIEDVPIILPTKEEIENVELKTQEIVSAQKTDSSFDYRHKLEELDQIVFEIYRITPEEQEEVRTWYRRHYPKLFNQDAEEE
jgi:hypothetical protein